MEEDMHPIMTPGRSMECVGICDIYRYGNIPME